LQWCGDEQLRVTSVVVKLKLKLKLLISERVYSVVTGEKRAWWH
jgi:hypothetical protein